MWWVVYSCMVSYEQSRVRLNWCDDCVVWLVEMTNNETATCWNSTGQCISIKFHICMSCILWAEHSWEPPNADGLWSCLVKTVNPETCQGQLKDIQVPLLSIGNHIFPMSTNSFLTQKVMLVLWTPIGIIDRDTEIEPFACSVQNSWGSIVDGSDVHMGTTLTCMLC
jgi:hypothetical protein